MGTQIKEHLVRISVKRRIYRWFWEPGVTTLKEQKELQIQRWSTPRATKRAV